MEEMFADRIHDVPRSFIREILKASIVPDIISFAGGLPNRELFPKDQLRAAADKVFEKQGASCLQYSNSEGLIGLREFIAQRYRKEQDIEVDPENILITNGSQQALDLIAKVIVNDGDQVLVEEPGYLGAIQALSLYRPIFLPVSVSDDGMNCEELQQTLESSSPKLMYTVPNFQNPAGISYPVENRKTIAGMLKDRSTLLVEDDPYGALRFKGSRLPSFYHFLPEKTLMLGSFSKVVVPGFRIGWVVAPKGIFEKLLVAKQASDLHSSNFTQAIILQFLQDNNIDDHIALISEMYGRQCNAMLDAIDEFFPADVTCTRPEGGMFLWGQLPDKLSSLKLFEKAMEQQVIFVPGEPFYTRTVKTNTFRLNFSCVDEKLAQEGIKRLARAIGEMNSI